jgi:hypothetical protein
MQDTESGKRMGDPTGAASRPMPQKGNFRVLLPEEAGAWDAFVSAHPLGRGRVTSRSTLRWKTMRWSFAPIARFDGDRIVAGAALCARKIPYIPKKVLLVPAILPPLGDSDAAESTESLLAAIETYAGSIGALEIKIHLILHEGIVVAGRDQAGELRRALDRAGYRADQGARGTYLVRIDRTDEELVRSFGEKCRRDVRKGLREGATVRHLEDLPSLASFCEAHTRMRDRKNLTEKVPSVNYAVLRPMFEKGDLLIFGVFVADVLRNMAMVDSMGIPRYMYGASTDALFEKGLPPTGQPLHYEIMRWLRERGKIYYDLGGSPGPVPEEGHTNFTVWRFKHEFAGEFVRTVPVHRRSIGVIGSLLNVAMDHLDRKRKADE